MPRSPSRDRSDRFIGDPRRYFRSWNLLEKWKLWLSGVALFLVVGWAVASFAARKESEYQVSHGPLTNPHATWDSRCEACHRNEGGFLDAHAKWNTLTCEKCHAAPDHYNTKTNATPYPTNDCGSCHHDHKGRENSLVKMSDSHCVRCHIDMQSNNYAKKVTGFNIDHPEFKALGTNKRPSTIKFSHGQHMTAGMVLAEGAKGAWTLAKIPADQLEKYRKPGQAITDAVQLDCKSCHSLDATTRAEGKYFAPINFEQSCKACHLTNTPSMPTEMKQVVEPFAVPHGKQFGELSHWIEAAYSKELQKSHPALAQSANPFDPKRPIEPAVKAFQDDVKQATAKATQFLEMQCMKCHEFDGKLVKPTAIPTVWLTHATFNHTSHRATDCKSCHPNAVAKFVGNETNYEREPVNILGIESCQKCHAPQQGSTGGIKHGCTDCHRFHGGDQPLHGRGNLIRVPKESLMLEEFLKGTK